MVYETQRKYSFQTLQILFILGFVILKILQKKLIIIHWP